MRSDKQKQASKNNGSKSQGPTSNTGKANSSKNATKHGLSTKSASILLLNNESQEALDAYATAFFARFQPIDLVEVELVQQMVSAIWRLRRMDAAETAILDIQIDEQRPQLDEIFDDIDEIGRTGLAVRHLFEKSNSLDLLMRYRAQARRSFVTALKMLQLLQGSRFNATVPLDPDQPLSVPTPPNSVPQPEPPSESAQPEPQPQPEEQDQPETPSARAPRTVSFVRKPLVKQELPNEPDKLGIHGDLLKYAVGAVPLSH